MDHQLAAKEVHTLSHAHETEPLTILRFERESHSGIGDLQLKTIARAAQPDERTLGGTVFDDVVEGLLHDAEYTERDFSRNRHRHVGMREFDLDGVLKLDVAAVTSNGGDETQGFQLRWMKLIRQSVDVGGDLTGLVG